MLKRILLGGAALVLAVGGWFAWKLRPQVDDIPPQLEVVDEAVDHLAVTLRAQGPLPALTLRELEGHTAFFFIQGKESMQAGEGTQLSRALARWRLDDAVRGYFIGDAEGMGLLADKIEDSFVKHMREETKWPIYLDFDNAMLSTFKLPKGHTGFVVLGPRGEILFRHSGNADPAQIEEIRAVLGAAEPAAAPEAPSFSIAGLDREVCAAAGCILVFLDEKLARADIPGIEGGWDGDMQEGIERGKRPSVRNLAMLLDGWQLAGTGIRGAVIGTLEGVEIEGVTIVEDSPDLREAFDVAPDEAAMLIVKGGRIAFHERGRIPFWKLGLAGDVLGIESVRGAGETEDEE